MPTQTCSWWSTVCLFVVVLVSWQTAGAAQGTSVIWGTVTDGSGAVLPGSTLTLKNTETGVARTFVSDSGGQYRFPALQPSRYTLTAELSGFATVQLEGIVVTIGSELRHDLKLEVQTLAETITVTAEAPAVDVTKSEVSGVVTQRQIDTLPINSRQYLNLALLMPGTSQDATRPIYNNVNLGSGVTFYSNNFMADGVANNWAQAGEPRQDFPQGSIREFKVNMMQSKSEYGLATGGMITVVSKSGTNELHGDAFEYFRHKALNTRNFFETTKPDFQRHQFGFALGGPMVRDRTHFFGAFERTVQDQFFTVSTNRPEFYSAVEGTFARPRRVNLYSVRVDHELREAQSIFGRYAQQEESSVCGSNSCGGRNAANAGIDARTPRRALVAGHAWVFGSNAVNEFRFQYAKAIYQVTPTGTPFFTEVGEYPLERISPDRIQRRLQFPSLTYGSFADSLGPESRWQVRDTLAWHLPSGRGSHDVKVGFDFSYIPFTDDTQFNLNGSYVFAADQYFNPNDPVSIANLQNPLLFTMSTPPASAPQPTKHLAWFVQDDWRPLTQLTVSAGLRYDLQIGSFNENLKPTDFRIPIAFIDPTTRGDKNNFGPRLGLAYDVTGSGGTVVRAGYGVYYDNVRTVQNQSELLNLTRYDIRISNPSYPDPFMGLDPLTFASTAPANLLLLSNTNFKNPRAQQYNAGVSRQLTADLAIHADGVYSDVRGDRKTENINLLDPANGRRPYPEWGRVDVESSLSHTKYRGLFVRVDKRFSRRHQFLVSYSLVKSEDNAPAARFIDQSNPALDWGPSAAERRHSLTTSGSVLMPYDVQLGAVLSVRSRLPFSATAGRDLNGDTFVSDLVPGTGRNQGNRGLDLSLVNAWRAANGLAAVSADDIDSTRFASVDVRASKSVKLTPTLRVELIAQVFNLFNTVNLGGIQTNALVATFGRASTAGDGRQAEIAARLVW